MKIPMILILMACLAYGCYYDNEEYLFPVLTGDCDTTAISYSNDVQPIINENCILCHSNFYAASLGGNIKLENFSDVVNQSTAILGALKHEPAYSAMPKGGSKLTNCKILTIEAWITQGKPEN